MSEIYHCTATSWADCTSVWQVDVEFGKYARFPVDMLDIYLRQNMSTVYMVTNVDISGTLLFRGWYDAMN